LALALWPFAWFLYGVVYADALFLALAIGAVVLVERDRYVLAGIVGAFATACRPTGIVLVPTLVAIAMTRDGVLRPRANRSATTPGEPEGGPRAGERLSEWLQMPSGIDWTRLRPRTLAPAISVAGLMTYSAFLWRRFGDPLAFATNQATFRGRMPLIKGPFFSRLVHVVDTPLLTSTMVLNAATAVLVLAVVGGVARRFGFPYALLVLATLVAVVVPTDNFIGVGRYMLLAFPALAVVGERLADRGRASWAVAALSAALMLTMAAGFSRSVYLS
jgi:hypothetical protein